MAEQAIETSKDNIEVPRKGIERQTDEGGLVLRLAPSERSVPSSRQHSEFTGDRIADVVDAPVPDTGAADQPIARGPNIHLIVQKPKGKGGDILESVDGEECTGLGVFQQQDRIFRGGPEV